MDQDTPHLSLNQEAKQIACALADQCPPLTTGQRVLLVDLSAIRHHAMRQAVEHNLANELWKRYRAQITLLRPSPPDTIHKTPSAELGDSTTQTQTPAEGVEIRKQL